MNPLNQDALDLQKKSRNLPKVSMPESKIIELLVESGRTEIEAKRIVGVMNVFNSAIMLNNQIVKIQETD